MSDTTTPKEFEWDLLGCRPGLLPLPEKKVFEPIVASDSAVAMIVLVTKPPLGVVNSALRVGAVKDFE